MKVLVPLGTRPEIVKLAPVVRALRPAGFDVRVVATGQHYDASLAGSFFDRLGLAPDEVWLLPDDEAGRVGALHAGAMRELGEHPTDVVVALGDTYTVPAFALAARRHGVPFVHLEAGLRSLNPTSMEEVNRRVAAVTASLHLAPTSLAAACLTSEGVPAERVRVVGNPVIDLLVDLGVRARPLAERRGVAVTVHRMTNVDRDDRLAAVVEVVERLHAELGPVNFPVHPRTRKRLEATGHWDRLGAAGVVLRDPLPYDDMLELLARSRVVVTDSGGLQEEASWLGIPVVVLRRSTPRWEGVALGTAVLAGLDVDLAVGAARHLATDAEQRRVAALDCPYGDGSTGTRVAAALRDAAAAGLLRIDEPDFVGRPVPVP